MADFVQISHGTLVWVCVCVSLKTFICRDEKKAAHENDPQLCGEVAELLWGPHLCIWVEEPGYKVDYFN